MANQQTICGDPQYLKQYLQEQLNEQDEQAIREHLESCEACQKLLESVAAQDSLWRDLKQHLVDTDPEETIEVSRLSRIMEWIGPTDDPAMLGRIGSYEVCGVIGEGSTGVVFKAFEARLNRYVSIKVLAPEFAANGAARKRFAREARAVAAVLHENVIPIYAVDEKQGIPYIVMQYIPGMSLLQRIESKGPLDTCEVARIGLQVARGLAAAHDQGIVHRDVKPANVIVENSVERALVTDFGLARVADEGEMTRTGTIAGTPQYMSPEQARGESIDHRSDLFSLGSLLYTACTGRPPFRAETIFGVINRVCTTTPAPIKESNPDVADWLVAFINKLMTKSSEGRFQDAHEVADLLAKELAYLQDPVNQAAPARAWLPVATRALPVTKTEPVRASRTPWVAALVVLAAVIGGGWMANAMWKSGKSLEPQPMASSGVVDEWQKSDTPQEGLPEETTVEWKQSGEEWGSNGAIAFEQRIRTRFPVKEDGVLTIRIDQADVFIQPSILTDQISATVLRRVKSGSQEEAEVLTADCKLVVNGKQNPTLTASFEGSEERKQYFDRSMIRLSVPANCELDLETAAGNISIGEMKSNVVALSRYGKIQLDHIEGDVNVTTTGDIDLTEGATGEVDLLANTGNVYASGIVKKGRIRTSGGHIHLGKSTGKVYAQTSGGHVVVRDVAGETSAHAIMGDLYLKLSENPTGLCYFSATQGDVEIDLYDTVQTEFKVAGELVTDLEFEELQGEDKTSLMSQKRVVCNGGGNVVRADCVAGTLSLNVHKTDPKANKSLGGSGLGGSGSSGSSSKLTRYAREKTQGPPRAGAIATVKLESEGMDGYTMYLPESFDPERDEAYPVIVYLQGAYGVGGEVDRVNKWGLCRLIRDERDLSTERNQLLLDTFIVVSPHIQKGQYDDHPEIVQDIIDEMVVSYNGDPSRVYLTGLSRGGHGTWGLADKLPQTFAAIVPIAGSPNNAKRFRNFTKLPTWIAHNRGDSSVNVDKVEKAVGKIEALGGEDFYRIETMEVGDTDYLTHRHILNISPVDGHDAWTAMYCSTELYKWLLQQQQAEE